MRTTASRARGVAARACALWLAIAALAAPCRSAVSAPAAELRARTTSALAELETTILDSGRPFDRQSADLQALAGELESAGLDSLASDVRLGSARALLRLSRNDAADEQFSLSIAAAVRAHDPVRELRARIAMYGGRVLKDPVQTRAGVQELLARAQATGRDDLQADAHFALSRAADELGDFETSLAEARQALSFASRAGDRNLTLRSLSQCGTELRLLHRNAESLVYTDSVISVATREGLDAPLARALFDRASILRQQEQFEAALAAIDQAIAIHRRRGDHAPEVTAVLLRANVLFRMKRYRECADATRALLAAADVRNVPVTWARIEELHGRALNAAGRAADAETLFAHVMPDIERYRAGLPTERERASLGVHVYNNYAAWTRARIQLGRARAAWETSERGHAIALESVLGLRGEPDLPGLQAHLRANDAAFVAWDVPDPLMANVVVVTPDTVAGFRLRGDGVLEEDLASVLDRARAEHALPPAPEAAARVSRALLQDVWSLIRRVRHLYFVPPALLEMLPLEALPPPNSPGPALGETFGITYVPSAAVLRLLQSRPVSTDGLAVFADPAVDGDTPPLAGLDPTVRGAVCAPLPGAREDARRLQKLGARVFVGREATIERVRAERSTAVLHFATHALPDGGTSAPGGLVLAGAQPILGPAAVESLHVTADLVTLAACATQGTEADLGEGPRGLARAFIVSGARSVITTRWEVSDRAAGRFTVEFYDRLRRGEARDQSLADARRRMLAEGFPPRDCWAFSLTGVGDEPVVSLAPGKPAALHK